MINYKLVILICLLNTISIYPNPSEGIFNISIEGVSGTIQIKVFDIHGNDYLFYEIEETRNIKTEKLNLKELAAGVYFINFTGKDFSQVKRLLFNNSKSSDTNSWGDIN